MPNCPGEVADGLDFRSVVDRFQTDLIREALEADGRQQEGSGAAQLLGLNRTTLTEKIKKLGLAEPS